MTTATVQPATPTNNINNNNTTVATGMIRARFEDFEDLSRRMVLLPRVEDEGAVVASYEPSSSGNTNAKRKPKSPSPSPELDDGDHKVSAYPTQGVISAVSSDSTECRDEKEDTLIKKNKHQQNHANTDIDCDMNLVGCVLMGIASSEDGNNDAPVENLRDADFAYIFSALRSQTGPIVLELEPSLVKNDDNNLRMDKSSSTSEVEEEKKEEECHGTAIDTDSSHDDTFDRNTTAQRSTTAGKSGVPTSIISTTSTLQASNARNATPNSTNNNMSMNSNLLSGRLLAFGSRMRASAQLAAETASTVAAQSIQAAAASRAAGAKQRTESSNQQQTPPSCCGLHVQTSLGAFLPLTDNPSSSSHATQSSTATSATHKSVALSPRSELTVTTSSCLYIRKSAVEACPPRGFTYQWYKGLPSLTEDSSLDDEWIVLPGANSANFQPSTTEVGYRLLCLVTVEPKVAAAAVGLPSSPLLDSYDDNSDSDSESVDSSDLDDHSLTPGSNFRQQPTIVKCITPHVVAADLSLFNGARQALVRGANFGGLQGQGKAHGRTFRVQVEMGSNSSKKKKKVASVLKMDQVSGEIAAPMHVEPLFHVTANTSHFNSKALELKFRMSDLVGSGNSTSILSALVSDSVLELVAPNRFARESLLLTIGIANFKGKPSELNATTILYGSSSDNEDEAEDMSSEDGSSSSSIASLSTPSKRSPATNQERGPQVVDNLVLSPAESNGSRRRTDDASIASISSAGDLSTLESASVSASLVQEQEHQCVQGSIASSERQAELEQEIAFLRTKLLKKDKVVSELQRHVARSDSALQHANEQVSQCQQQVNALETEVQSSQRFQKAAEQMVDQHLDTMKKVKAEHSGQISKLKQQLEFQAAIIADLKKTNTSHQNEKAVLAAAIEARESKLGKMAELQDSYVSLSSKVSQQEQWKKELDENAQRYQELKGDLQKVTQLEHERRNELDSTKETLRSLSEELHASKDTAESCRKELKTIQTKNQKLKSERNSYKQKADSLAKEISRICRNGRTLADVEKVLADDEARQEEVELLRKQKRKALEECHSYRKSYEQSRTAQHLMVHANASPSKKVDPNNNAALLLERNVELERLVTELTEYVNAKEMQLETMKQVNAALQEEIHGLAQANMHRNEI